MSEYWKSTPKYWCKYCGIYVRDTKLERANHEATGKHQGALKRSLRDLHRGHEREEREKERARREIERLNGVSRTTTASQAEAGGTKAAGGGHARPLATGERQRQLEQLADLGINVPAELRSNVAMVGEWAVTSTRVIEELHQQRGDDQKPPQALASGARKRERDRTEGDDAEQHALGGLLKRPKNWGRDSRILPAEDDTELDELLNASLEQPRKTEATGPTIPADAPRQDDEEDLLSPIRVKSEVLPSLVKEESALEGSEQRNVHATTKLADATEAESVDQSPTVMFKRRRPKNLRQN